MTEKQHTKDMLADALRAAGLPEMAERAAEGYYHDYLSPLDLPGIELVHDLKDAGAMENDKIMAVYRRVISGDFEASNEEAEAWASSPDGQDAFSKIGGS